MSTCYVPRTSYIVYLRVVTLQCNTEDLTFRGNKIADFCGLTRFIKVTPKKENKTAFYSSSTVEIDNFPNKLNSVEKKHPLDHVAKDHLDKYISTCTWVYTHVMLPVGHVRSAPLFGLRGQVPSAGRGRVGAKISEVPVVGYGRSDGVVVVIVVVVVVYAVRVVVGLLEMPLLVGVVHHRGRFSRIGQLHYVSGT